MTQRVTVPSGKVICFIPEHSYEFMGKGYIYSYHSEGEGSALVQVTNNLKGEWLDLAKFTDIDSCVVAHSWKFQRVITDTLQVYVHKDN